MTANGVIQGPIAILGISENKMKNDTRSRHHLFPQNENTSPQQKREYSDFWSAADGLPIIKIDWRDVTNSPSQFKYWKSSGHLDIFNILYIPRLGCFFFKNLFKARFLKGFCSHIVQNTQCRFSLEHISFNDIFRSQCYHLLKIWSYKLE